MEWDNRKHLNFYVLYEEIKVLSVRLDHSLEQKLAILSRINNKTKTDIIKDALTYYFDMLKVKEKATPYELGKGLFGVAGSHDGTLSTHYKKIYKEMLDEKHNHR